MDISLLDRSSPMTRGTRRVHPEGYSHSKSRNGGGGGYDHEMFQVSTIDLRTVNPADPSGNAPQTDTARDTFVYKRRRDKREWYEEGAAAADKVQGEEEILNKCQQKYGRVFCRLRADARKREVLPSYGRSKLALDSTKALGGFAKWKHQRALAWKRTKVRWREFTIRMEIWRDSFKTIEGHYGSGVAAYFVFLKWLFILNLWIFLLMFIFIVVPQIVFTSKGYDWWSVGNTSTERLNLSAVCSELYHVELSWDDIPQVVLDFLQGTGWMEPTVLFYGYYSDRRLAIGSIDGVSYSYNMPLAYLLVTVSYLIISLIMMVRHTAKGMKARIVESEDKYFQYCGLILAGWDYSMNDPKSIKLKHKSLNNEMAADLEEERRQERRRGRTCCSNCRLYTLRFLINVFVVICLGGAGYLIYYATEQSALLLEGFDDTGEAYSSLYNVFNQQENYESLNKFLKLLMEYVPSLTITFLNFVLPFIFQKIVKGEDYSPDTEVQVTLGRTVFLRLASLAVLIATIYSQVTCSTKDFCDVGEQPDCPAIRCWETYVGQQIYKLVIMDFITVMGVVLFVNFPRTLIVTKCNCKLAQIVGKPEFEIPKNVLDLVYSQTLCWLGAFFSPLIPAICVLVSFLVFYLKKVTCIYNHVPTAKPYRASKSHAFFMIVLLTAFLLICIPIGYIIWLLPPSKGCGPFRVYEYMYEIVNITIETWPTVLQTIVSFIVSAGFVIPLVALLCVLSYYFSALAGANKEMANLLKEQLVLEGKDKQFLLTRINELSGEGPPGRGKQIGKHNKPKPPPPASADSRPDTNPVSTRAIKMEPEDIPDANMQPGW